MFSISWTDLKTLADDNSWKIYYHEIKDLEGNRLCYVTSTGNSNHQYLAKPLGADETEFEDDYKTDAVSVADAAEAISKIEDVNKAEIVQVTPFSSNSVQFSGEGKHQTITAGETESIDFKVTYDALLNGGLLQAINAKAGDSIKAEVIDKDGVYAPANTVLNVWIPKWPVLVGEVMDLTTPQAGNIPKDVYLRITYTSTGSTDVDVIVDYKLNKDIS